jgi:hypothetical protein
LSRRALRAEAICESFMVVGETRVNRTPVPQVAHPPTVTFL